MEYGFYYLPFFVVAGNIGLCYAAVRQLFHHYIINPRHVPTAVRDSVVDICRTDVSLYYRSYFGDPLHFTGG